MKRFYLALMFVLFLCSSCFALSDKDYLRLKKNSRDFAKADAELNQVYNQVKDVLTAREFERVKREQRNWGRTGRDAFAKKRMNEGDSKAEAYTAATIARTQELRFRYISGDSDGYDDSEDEPKTQRQTPERRQIRKSTPEPEDEPEEEPDYRQYANGIAVEDIQGIYKHRSGSVLKISYLGEIDDNEVQVNFDSDNGESHERWSSRGIFDGARIELETDDNGEAVLIFNNSTTVTFKVDADFKANGFFSEESGIEGTYYKQ